MAENKVQFGLKNVHYAVLTETTSQGTTTYSWATPVAIPGAVNLSLEAQGENTPFYADNITYYVSTSNSGYEGDLEIARIPDSMLADVWGMVIDTTSKVLTESANIEPKRFALLFQIDGDQNNTHHVLYNCTASRPSIASATKEDSTDPQTDTIQITAVPLSDDTIRAKTTDGTSSTIVAGWYTSVYRET